MNSRETGKRDRGDRERAARGRTRTGFRKTGGPPRRSGEAHPLRPIGQRNRWRAKRHLAAARARAGRCARSDLARLQQRGAGAVAVIAIGGGQLAVMRCIRRCVVVSVDMVAEVLCPAGRLVAAIRRCHAPAREERHENQQQQGQPTTHRGESSSALFNLRHAPGIVSVGPLRTSSGRCPRRRTRAPAGRPGSRIACRRWRCCTRCLSRASRRPTG